jgi:hypothetical protein
MALSADTALNLKNVRGEMEVTGVVKTAYTLYKHGLIMALSSGLLRPCANVASTTKFVGLSKKGYAAGETATLYTNIWAQVPLKTGVSAAHLHHEVYAYDDEKAFQGSTLGPAIGTLEEIVSATSGWIWLGHVPNGHST